MLARTIDALRALRHRQIAVVGNDAVRAECASRRAGANDSRRGNGRRQRPAARSTRGQTTRRCCISPAICPTSMRLRCSGCWIASSRARFRCRLPSTRTSSRRFPDAPPFGITLAGERVVNAGVFHIPAGARARIRKLATTMFEARKAPWKMASVAGPLDPAAVCTGPCVDRRTGSACTHACSRCRLRHCETRRRSSPSMRTRMPSMSTHSNTPKQAQPARDRCAVVRRAAHLGRGTRHLAPSAVSYNSRRESVARHVRAHYGRRRPRGSARATRCRPAFRSHASRAATDAADSTSRVRFSARWRWSCFTSCLR